MGVYVRHVLLTCNVTFTPIESFGVSGGLSQPISAVVKGFLVP